MCKRCMLLRLAIGVEPNVSSELFSLSKHAADLRSRCTMRHARRGQRIGPRMVCLVHV